MSERLRFLLHASKTLEGKSKERMVKYKAIADGNPYYRSMYQYYLGLHTAYKQMMEFIEYQVELEQLREQMLDEVTKFEEES